MGTKPEIDGQTDHENEQELTFAQLSEAISNGTNADLSRLMTGDEQVEETPEVTEPEEKVETEETLDTESPDGEPATEGTTEVETPEAAAAASPEEDLQKELHRLRSDAGRVPHMQRRMQELERELRAIKARAPQSTATADAVSTEGVEIPANLKKKYDQIRETDPDLADTLEETVKLQIAFARSQGAAAVESSLQAQQEEEDRRFFEEQSAKLHSMVPEASRIFAMPEWKQWKESLTPGRKALASSGYADEMAQALHAFAIDYQAARGQPVIQTTTTATPAAAPAATPENPTQVARERKVATAAPVATPAARTTRALTEEQQFREFYDKLYKEQYGG